MELTSVIGYFSVRLRTSRRASSKLPRMATTWAPWPMAWLRLPNATLPSGIKTMDARPARAAYAAAEAEVFPVDAHMTAWEPASFALVSATVIPRSLKEPVGLSPSYFTYTSASMPKAWANRETGMRGVAPSSRVTISVSGPTGMNGRYASMIPRYIPLLSFNPDDVGDAAHHGQGGDLLQRRLHVPLQHLVGDEHQADRVFSPALLNDGTDAHFVVAEGLRNLG